MILRKVCLNGIKTSKFVCFSNQILYKKEAIGLKFKIEKCMHNFKMLSPFML